MTTASPPYEHVGAGPVGRADARRCRRRGRARARRRAATRAGRAPPEPSVQDRTLKVTSIEPDRGDINGDHYVLIKGNRFVADGPRRAEVYFGTQQTGFRKGTVVRFASDKQLIVRTPGGKPGEVVDVLVTFEPGGQLRLPNAFTYVERSSGPP